MQCFVRLDRTALGDSVYGKQGWTGGSLPPPKIGQALTRHRFTRVGRRWVRSLVTVSFRGYPNFVATGQHSRCLCGHFARWEMHQDAHGI